MPLPFVVPDPLSFSEGDLSSVTQAWSPELKLLLLIVAAETGYQGGEQQQKAIWSFLNRFSNPDEWGEGSYYLLRASQYHAFATIFTNAKKVLGTNENEETNAILPPGTEFATNAAVNEAWETWITAREVDRAGHGVELSPTSINQMLYALQNYADGAQDPISGADSFIHVAVDFEHQTSQYNYYSSIPGRQVIRSSGTSWTPKLMILWVQARK